MKPVIKRAFQITGATMEDRNLMSLQEMLTASAIMLQQAKADYTTALSRRNRALNSIMRSRFGYLPASSDYIKYNPDTGELVVYDVQDSGDEQTEF